MGGESMMELGQCTQGDRVSPVPQVLKLLSGHQERRQEKSPKHPCVPTANLSLSLLSPCGVEPGTVDHEVCEVP